MPGRTGRRQPIGGRRRVGDYVLERQLGVGATSSAWLARRGRGRRKVCIKLLHPHLVNDPVARARLAAEAAAARVSHPGVVPVLDVVVNDTDAALVFPFLEGETLSVRLAREGRLAPADAARICRDVAAALAGVHAAGFVHRDVKPSNILLGADGSARLLDFGIAHAVSVPVDELTGAGMTIGTLPYMSPEQLAAHPPKPATDVFALGAVLYEMLAGHRPYDAPTPTALAVAHRQPPADVPDAPRPLLALAWAALAREAHARPSATGLTEGLESWLREGTLPAPPLAALPTRRVRVSRQMPTRSPVAGGIAAAALVGLVLVTVLALTPVLSAPSAPSSGLPPADAVAEPAASSPDVQNAQSTRAGIFETIAGILDRLAAGFAADADKQAQPVVGEQAAGAEEAAEEADGGDGAKSKAGKSKDREGNDRRGGNRGRGGGDDDD